MKYQYCPKCGGDLKEVFLNEEKHQRLKCQKCGFVFYQNSKPTSSALIVAGDKILLGRRKVNPAKGDWDIPGGFLELGEHPEDGLRREIMEELGVEIKIKSLLGFFMDVYGDGGDATLNICYIVEIIKGEPSAADDVEDIKWFNINELPENLAFQNGKDMLEALRKEIYIK
ncbi:MAG: NUDIX hydrolase [Patescibacteria group bacterium]|jgi:ADP-ribose pyrophosphatase YjhB (NUDIX family)